MRGNIISNLAVAETYSGYDFATQAADLRVVPDPFEAPAISVAEMPEDALSCRRAERLMRVADSLGPLVLAAVTENSSEEQIQVGAEVEAPRHASLLELIRAAETGDRQARKGVANNVRTDVVERSIKSGHVTEVELQVDDQGRVVQHGQAMEDVFVNGLRFASTMWQMRQRTEAEVRNGMRIEDCLRRGLLDEYDLVVVSRPADDMTPKQMEDCGFFIETMSSAIQVVGKRGSRLVQESAFVAGVAGPGAERHDAVTVEKLMAGLGVNVSGKSATEMLDTPILVPKTLMPDGVIDIVRRYDQAAGGTFYGEAKQVQDYDRHRESCRKREAELAALVDAVVEELVASSGELRTPTDATDKLAKLSEAALVNRAVTDDAIDLRVFGAESAQHIRNARYELQYGDEERFMEAMRMAQQTARSSSCPSSGSSEKGEEGSEMVGADGRVDIAKASSNSESERKAWKVKQGLCRVKGCPSRPGKTRVGPCGVCMDRCQAMFDAGKDPTKQLA